MLDQWIARLRNFLELNPKKIGQIGRGKRKTSGIIDVAIIQSISRKGAVDDIVGEYGYLDLIAAGIAPFQPEKLAIRAGKLMLMEIKALVLKGESFAFETTLSVDGVMAA